MGRYIDVDALKIPSEEIIAKMIINSAPSIDIVRCKECKYQERCEQIVVFNIGENQLEGRKIDFCSYGKRKEG